MSISSLSLSLSITRLAPSKLGVAAVPLQVKSSDGSVSFTSTTVLASNGTAYVVSSTALSSGGVAYVPI